MAYTQFRNGFSITTSSAIDERIILSKEQMVTAEDDFSLPDVYFCICSDNGRVYLYDVNNVPNNDTGKFRPVDELISFDTDAAKENFNEVLKESEVISQVDADLTEIKSDVEEIKEQVIIMNGGEIKDE